MLEHPPDAHRGFDVPAAIITVGDAPKEGPTCSTDSLNASSCTSGDESDDISGSSAAGGSYSALGVRSGRVGGKWQVLVADGTPSAAELQSTSPLMAQMMHQGPPTVRGAVIGSTLVAPQHICTGPFYQQICLLNDSMANRLFLQLY